MREEWIIRPENISARDLKQFDTAFRQYVVARVGTPKPRSKPKRSSILKRQLPAAADDRIALLRKHNNGRLPLFDLYLAGEHQKVWQELNALGPTVREDPHAADAMAVAYETMRRVESNVRTITARLQALGHRGAPGGGHQPPAAEIRKLIARVEKAAGMLPLSQRAFYEVVGAVNWTVRSHLRDRDFVRVAAAGW
jgi:hypothetical protein